MLGLRDALVQGLTSCGVDVVDIGVVPTPLLYWSLTHLDVGAGIQITGSHNPPEYNGFKISLGTAPLMGAEIQELHEPTAQGEDLGERLEAMLAALGSPASGRAPATSSRRAPTPA